jgi:hypothetical protein
MSESDQRALAANIALALCQSGLSPKGFTAAAEEVFKFLSAGKVTFSLATGPQSPQD